MLQSQSSDQKSKHFPHNHPALADTHATVIEIKMIKQSQLRKKSKINALQLLLAGTPGSVRSGASRARRRESLSRAYRWFSPLTISYYHLLYLISPGHIGDFLFAHLHWRYRIIITPQLWWVHVHDLILILSRVHEFSCKLDLPRRQNRTRGTSSRSNKVEN